MENKSSSRTKAKLLVVAVFLIGVLAGALSMNLYRRVNAPSAPTGHGSHYVFDKLNRTLNLTPDQQNKIRDILNDTFSQYSAIGKDIEPRINTVRQESRNRIRAVLTKDQLPKFEEMVAESDKKREQRNEHNK